MTLSWMFFRHYLFSRRAGATVRIVAWLCMAGVSVGILSLVVVMSVMNGFNEQIRNRLLAVEPHLVVRIPNVNRSEILSQHSIYKDLKNRSGVTADLFERQDVILRTVDGLFGGAIAKGVEDDSVRALVSASNRRFKLDQTVSPENENSESFGPPPIADESAELGAGEVLMGIDLARGLGVVEGDKLIVITPEALLLPEGEAPSFERITVKGLVTTNVPDIDSKVIFYKRNVSFNAFQNSPSLESGYEVRLPNPENFDEIRKQLVSQGANVETWIERNSSLFYALKLEKLAMGFFLGLSALIASFSIVTVLVLLLTQKRKDIGLLMGLGLSAKRTRTLFVNLGLILSSIGIGGGVGLGVLICLWIDNTKFTFLPSVYIDTTIPAKIEPLFIVGILLASGLIAFLSAWWPTRMATQESPSEAMRAVAAIKGTTSPR